MSTPYLPTDHLDASLAEASGINLDLLAKAVSTWLAQDRLVRDMTAEALAADEGTVDAADIAQLIVEARLAEYLDDRLRYAEACDVDEANAVYQAICHDYATD